MEFPREGKELRRDRDDGIEGRDAQIRNLSAKGADSSDISLQHGDYDKKTVKNLPIKT